MNFLDLLGNEDAAALNADLYQIVEMWDDLIDKDAATPDAGINAAFYTALIKLPRNAFYQRHFALLSPILESAILDWYAANALEKRRTGDDLRTSFILRCGVQAFTVMCARIIGGVDFACSVNLQLRSAGDSWAEYAAEFGEK